MKAGWAQKQLADVCDVFTDGDWIESKDQSGEGIRLIQTGNVGEGRFKDRGDKARFISADTFRRLKCTEIFQGDCIISRLPDPVGRSCMLPDTAGERMITAVDCTVVRFKPTKVIPEFFVYYTQSTDYLKAAARACSGATRQRISRSKLGDIALPVPPLAEQKRIVAILDQAFEAIDTAKGNAEKNVGNGKELFENYLTDLLLRRSKAWRDEPLSDICVVERGSSPRPIKKYFTTEREGVNWIKIGDTEEGGKYVSSTEQKITPEGAQQSRYVRPGDLILTNSMSYGRPYIMATHGYIHDGWFVLRPNDDIDTEYFYYLLSSRHVQAQFGRLASGSVVKNISGDLVKQAVMPIPPVSEQRQIVEKLRRMETEEEHLGSIYAQRLSNLSALKGAILDHAFSGQL